MLVSTLSPHLSGSTPTLTYLVPDPLLSASRAVTTRRFMTVSTPTPTMPRRGARPGRAGVADEARKYLHLRPTCITLTTSSMAHTTSSTSGSISSPAMSYVAHNVFIRYDSVSDAAGGKDILEQVGSPVDYANMSGLLAHKTRMSSSPQRQTHIPTNGRGVRLQHTALMIS